MSDSPFPPLRYFLPETVFTVTSTQSDEIVQVEGKHYLHPHTSIAVTPRIVADRTGRCTTTISTKFLESVDLTVSLSDDGVVESVGTTASRDIGPIVSLVGKVGSAALSVVGAVLGGAGVAAFVAPPRSSAPSSLDEQPSLEEQWALAQPHLAELHDNLTARVADYCKRLTAEGEAPARVVKIGAALAVLEKELGAVDRVRREWFSRQAVTADPVTRRLRTDDLVRVDGVALPERMTSGVAVPPAQAELAERGLLVALAETTPGFNAKANPPEDYVREDSLILRQARPVSVGIYKLDGQGQWQLDPTLVTDLDVVDRHSHYDGMAFDGKLWSKRTMTLALHPDGSVKTYAASSASTVSSAADAVGGAVSDVAAGVAGLAKLPSAEDQELAASKKKLELLKTSDEFAQLSATAQHSSELAELEQRVNILDAQDKLVGRG